MQRFSKKGLALIFALAVLLALFTVAAVIPSIRFRVKEYLSFNGRDIIAKTTGYITPEGPFVSVFKIREEGSLVLEVYTTPDEDGNPRLLQKIILDETRDGYFNFQGNATNLALSDTDQDGAMDILSPTYDEQMTARLNVFRFNRATQNFDRVIPPPQN
jgi:hypothetical protein